MKNQLHDFDLTKYVEKNKLLFFWLTVIQTNLKKQIICF